MGEKATSSVAIESETAPHLLPDPRSNRRRQLSFEFRIFWLVVLAAVPASLVTLALLWREDVSPPVRWSLIGLISVAPLIIAAVVREQIIPPLHTISNILSALREGDFSIRARGARRSDALGDVVAEVNTLSETLREQRLGAREASALLRTVMEEISVAIFAFDDAKRLQLTNRAGGRLLGQPVERLLGRTAGDLDLAECLVGDASRTLDRAFPGGFGRWGLRRTTFRQGGLRHDLLVLTDLSQALRAEERLAWQRLLRVLGHELNNSLAPIKSIAGSLEKLLVSEPRPSDWQDDVRHGLAIISSRTAALTKFMEDYSRLAKLPPPNLQMLSLEPLLRRVVNLEQRLRVQLLPGPELQVRADPVQLEQLLINLVRNAVDASLARRTDPGHAVAASTPPHSAVTLGWKPLGNEVEILIEDDGPGLANPGNLFVPFFTTKAGGSGIGLVLSRQIAEAHGGSLSLEPRPDAPGCQARLRLRTG